MKTLSITQEYEETPLIGGTNYPAIAIINSILYGGTINEVCDEFPDIDRDSIEILYDIFNQESMDCEAFRLGYKFGF